MSAGTRTPNPRANQLPFTPFHFGPGLLGKGLAPRWFSWSGFAVATVVIDCESAYYLATDAVIVHRQLHTFVGAALVGVATSLLLLGARRLLSRARVWFEIRSPTLRAEGSSLGLVVGAMTGAVTHPLFDGVMHRDIEPFQPWTAANPLQGAVGLGALHLGCLIAGIAGGVLLALRR